MSICLARFGPATARSLIGLTLLIGALAAAAVPGARAATPPTAGNGLPTLWIIGDSTVNNHSKGVLGWGDPIKEFFDRARINVVNRARGGRSSRTFREEGLWDAVLAEMKPGDFLLMQFGHNDGQAPTAPHSRGSLRGTGDETVVVTNDAGKKETVHTYGWYMRHYVSEAQAKGVTAIVLSPIPRNMWREGKVIRASGDYGKWAAESAAAEKAPFINLNELVATVYDATGPEKVKTLYFFTDHTHTTPAGARLNASKVVEGIRALKDCPLASYLLPEPTGAAAP